MNFHLSDDQVTLQDAVKRFVSDAAEAGVRRKVFESEDGFDPDFWNGLMALGLGGLGLYGDYDGLGLQMIDLALVAEVLGYEAAPGPFLGHTLAGLAIQQAGTPEQKAKWLPKLASGGALGTIALDESGDLWAPGDWTLSLEGGRLSGVKANVLYPERADVIVVGLKGGGLALVEGGEGVSSSPLNVADRTRRLWDVTFDKAPAEALDAGGHAGTALFDALLALLAADAFGGASRILQMTTDYAKTRSQFGQPIARFQGIKHRLANMASEIEPARGLYWYAAVAQDLKQEDRSRVAALAKAHLADRFNSAARVCVELHGGIGFTWEFDLQIWVKRAMFDYAYAGIPARHRRWALTEGEQAA